MNFFAVRQKLNDLGITLTQGKTIMSALEIPRLFTAEEYLARERDAPHKSEFFHGTIVAMAGASDPHIFINANLGRAVGNRIAGTGCREAGGDMKVRTASKGMFSYPDLTVVCGERLCHDAKRDVLLNPTVLFEILSPFTEAADRGEKFFIYQQLESLREYVLVSQNTPRVEWYVRAENNQWIYSVVSGLEASFTLPSLSVTLPLSEIYADIVFPPALSLED